MFKKISIKFLVLRSKHDVGRSWVSFELFSLSMLFRTLSVRNVGELGKNTLVFSSGFSVLPRGRYSRLEAETNRELYNPKKIVKVHVLVFVNDQDQYRLLLATYLFSKLCSNIEQ